MIRATRADVTRNSNRFAFPVPSRTIELLLHHWRSDKYDI
jgi:hypothetical protein